MDKELHRAVVNAMIKFPDWDINNMATAAIEVVHSYKHTLGLQTAAERYDELIKEGFCPKCVSKLCDCPIQHTYKDFKPGYEARPNEKSVTLDCTGLKFSADETTQNSDDNT